MNIALLDALTMGEDIDLISLQKFGSLTIYPKTLPHETARRLDGVDVVITNKVVIDKVVMDAVPSLKLVCIAATGMNNVDVEYAKEKGIIVKNVAGYSTESVVQSTFSHVFYLLCQHAYYDTYGKTNWKNSPIFTHVGPPFYELSGKRWGIIGLGAIGRRVAEVAETFGCEVIYYSTSGMNKNTNFFHVDLDDLLRTSHIISIHAPLNPQTENLIDFRRLQLIQNHGVIVNMGRGGIVNEDDLARILDERPIYAGLDVVKQEPIASDNPLLFIKHQERLSLTPHVAWTSIEARQRLVAGIAQNIQDFIKATEEPLY
ncbi:MAG: D-2-hydroxyacid dehydrogenase [Chlorobiales bacterium]|nr:D-2-hydroxyacid dehydrogenase [Chlorobiales bacterium]